MHKKSRQPTWKLGIRYHANSNEYTCAAISLHLISSAGGDYTPVTTDLTFNSTNAAIPQTVTIPILDDLLLEGSEVFDVTLTTNNTDVTLLPNLTTVTIEDLYGKLKEEISCLTTQWLPLVIDILKQQHNYKLIRAASLAILHSLLPWFISSSCAQEKEPGKRPAFFPRPPQFSPFVYIHNGTRKQKSGKKCIRPLIMWVNAKWM